MRNAWKMRSYVLKEKYEGLVFDRSLRGPNVASRVLGIGHPLFDIALDEASEVGLGVAAIEGLDGPLLVLAVEDELTGTGSLVQKLIFGVTERLGEMTVLRDWELLKIMNTLTAKPISHSKPAVENAEVLITRLKNGFDINLAHYAAAFRRPVSWPELLFVDPR